jgi:hypothetical protein
MNGRLSITTGKPLPDYKIVILLKYGFNALGFFKQNKSLLFLYKVNK